MTLNDCLRSQIRCEDEKKWGKINGKDKMGVKTAAEATQEGEQGKAGAKK